MEKRHRTILFIVALILFFIISLFVILYSQGYKFDFEKKKFVETGGFYIQIINNSPFSVYLNDKLLKKKPGLFSNSFFIKNLLPKKHKIEIKKDGYFSWQKTLEVKEKEVIKILDIL